MLWLLVVLLIIFAVVGVPEVGIWHHNYGYFPSGLGAILVILLVVLLLSGRL
jgi:hypothetical protein